jgi:AraC-like DNA-binding protein
VTPPPPSPTALVVAYVPRERPRAVLRAAFPRRRSRLSLARTAADVETALRTSLVDAVLVDLAGSTEEAWRVASLAAEFPSAAFIALTTLRPADAPSIAQHLAAGFADVLVEGSEDGVVRELVLRHGFTARFAAALDTPPPALGLVTPLQQAAWSAVVAAGGRPVRTATLAQGLDVTREHLSRSFSAEGAPNLKRVIDLVRLLAAAELAKNPGQELRDLAEILEFASPSHLATTVKRLTGTGVQSLARLRATDLGDRFARGHARSRA